MDYETCMAIGTAISDDIKRRRGFRHQYRVLDTRVAWGFWGTGRSSEDKCSIVFLQWAGDDKDWGAVRVNPREDDMVDLSALLSPTEKLDAVVMDLADPDVIDKMCDWVWDTILQVRSYLG